MGSRDLRNELLNLPPRSILRPGAVPTLHLLPDNNDDAKVKKTSKAVVGKNTKSQGSKPTVVKKQSEKVKFYKSCSKSL